MAPSEAFVNLFWGPNDNGFRAIQSKIHASLATLQELLYFYKERLAIESEYNKRLERLSSSRLGTRETGTLKVALDLLQHELEAMVAQHRKYMRQVLLGNYEKLQNFYRIYLREVSAIESHMAKVVAQKNDYLAYVDTTREKYRVACGQCKTLQLLCHTTWGKELEKNTAKLRKAEQLVAPLRHNYAAAVQKYEDVHAAWVTDWQIALSNVYQWEIERVQMCKLNCFLFCNQVATLCVDWDQAVDVARASFATVGAAKDAHDFAAAAGTGSLIVAPPQYVDYEGGALEHEPRVLEAKFQDPDYSSILTRTFSTHLGLGPVLPPALLAAAGPPPSDLAPQGPTPTKPSYSSQETLKARSPANVAAAAAAANVNKSLPPVKAHLEPQPAAQSGPLRKQLSHNSNYTSGAEDRHDVFDRLLRLQTLVTLSDYSTPTNYTSHSNGQTVRSWSSPRKKLAQELQREINRRLQDFSELLGKAPVQASPAKPIPLSKDFSIDFIAKALEDLNAGGNGDVSKFRRSVRGTSEVHGQTEPDRHDPFQEQPSARDQARGPNVAAKRMLMPALSTAPTRVAPDNDFRASMPTHDSVTFECPDRRRRAQELYLQNPDLQETVVRDPNKRRSFLQSPTKSYTNLRALVDDVTPVTRNKYVAKALARYSYKSREQGELSFKKGWHMYVIHKQEDNWYVCELGDNCGVSRGVVGLVPYNYVVEGDDVF